MMSEPRVKSLCIDEEETTIDWLMYRSYEFNRKRSPDIEPEKWRSIYLNQEKYEKIFQNESQGEQS